MGLVTKEEASQFCGTHSSSGNWLRTLPSQQTTADAPSHSQAQQRPMLPAGQLNKQGGDEVPVPNGLIVL